MMPVLLFTEKNTFNIYKNGRERWGLLGWGLNPVIGSVFGVSMVSPHVLWVALSIPVP